MSIQVDESRLASIKTLSDGKHNEGDGLMCAMEAVAYFESCSRYHVRIHEVCRTSRARAVKSAATESLARKTTYPSQ
jgi:hypothetical protein